MYRAFERAFATGLLIAGAVVISATPAGAATICDLRYGTGATCTIGSGVFFQDEQQPTGTGYIDSFLRIQQSGWEQGYNTSDRSYPNGPPYDKMQPIIQDKIDPNFTRNLKLSEVGTKTINGVVYAEFFLDVNEQASPNGKSWITLDQLEIFTSNTANLNCYYNTATKNCDTYVNPAATTPNTSSGTLFGATKVYDMDTGMDNWVQLDYNLNRGGSGQSDMVFYLPKALLTGTYVYLFSQFGDMTGNMSNTKYESGAGFEEWWTRSSTPPVSITAVPEPGSMLLLGFGLLGLGKWRGRRNRKPIA